MKIYKVLSYIDSEGCFNRDCSPRNLGNFRKRLDAINFATKYALTSDSCFSSDAWDSEKQNVRDKLSQKMCFDGAFERVKIKQSNMNIEKYLSLFTTEELEKEIASRKTNKSATM